MKKLAWSCASDEGYRAEVSLVMGKPEGELMIRCPSGREWKTVIGLDEIALFATGHEDMLGAYLDEMSLNAEAAMQPRIH